MKTTELKFQQQLIDDIKKSHRESYVIKVNHRFLAGIPDLLIKHPHYPVMFVETKLGVVGKSGKVKINTTGIQRSTMDRIGRSGITVAVWTLVQGDNEFILQSSWSSTEVEVHDRIVVSRINRKWPVDRLLKWPVGEC